VSRLAESRLKAPTKSSPTWPSEYVNSRTGKIYAPHNDDERVFVYDDVPRHSLLKGGEGAGKTTAGVVKDLERLRRGMNGVMVAPDLEHLKKSTWPEFKRWCPWDRVIERHRYRQVEGWEPSQSFTLVFENAVGGYSELMCGGAKESEIAAWEGPNVSFVHFDEARRHKTPIALKTFDGRVRIPGPAGEPPQFFVTTTPRKHWLFEYFGPLLEDDPHADFKADSFVGTVLTSENAANLEPGFAEKRAQSLNAAEERVLLLAEWEDEADSEKFLASMIWWDNCIETLPPLTRSEPMVIALDAARGGVTDDPDEFAMVGVTRHPIRRADISIRYANSWQPPSGGVLDFRLPEEELRRLCREFSVIEVAFDVFQLHDFSMRLSSEGIALFKEFSQGPARLKSDSMLKDLIMGKRISHSGEPNLRKHIDNSDYVKSGGGRRIVKRSKSLKVDMCVALSMAAARILYYNVE